VRGAVERTYVMRLAAGRVRPDEVASTGIRYYAFAGVVIGETTPSTLYWLSGTTQGTMTTSVAAFSQSTVIRRASTPSGTMLTGTGTWPDDRAFLGDPAHSSTGLADVGARKYDPALGLFLSPDPVLSTSNPQAMTRYTYAVDDPVTGSDPSGLVPLVPYIDDGQRCVGTLKGCEASEAATAASKVTMRYDPVRRGTEIKFDGYRFIIPDNNRGIPEENITAANDLNKLLQQQGNFYNGPLVGGNSGHGFVYVTPYEDDPGSVPDLIRITYLNGQPQSAVGVELYSPKPPTSLSNIQLEIQKKINGTQADAAVVRAANTQQADRIENMDYYFYGEDPPLKASVARFGNLLVVGRPSDIVPLTVPL